MRARCVERRTVATLGRWACLGLLWLGCPEASAQVDERVPIELAWSAPPECPDRSWVLRSIEARLRAPTSQLQAASAADARIDARAEGYVLTLHTGAGERQLSAASCEELAGSAALILAFLIEPQPQPEPPATPQTSSPGTRKRRQPEQLHGYARAEWLVDVGMLPNAATGPGLSLGVTWLDTSLQFSAGFFFDNTVSYVATGSEGSRSLAHMHALLAQLGLCQRWLRGPDLAVCVSVEHLRISADPDGSLQERVTPRAPVWSALASLQAAIPIGTQFAWMLELAVGVPLHGAQFSIRGLGAIHETGDVIGRLRTGPELRF